MPTFIDVLSTDRFDTYLQWANGDSDLGIRLYTFNTQLSACKSACNFDPLRWGIGVQY